MITIIGAKGSMGTRYQAILNYLEESFVGFDVEDSNDLVLASSLKSAGVIVCTPTHTHAGIVKWLLLNDVKNILCEKPLCKSVEELGLLYGMAAAKKATLNMVMQYSMLVSEATTGDSFYDYFRHGNDGLYWDCLQIIGLAKGFVSVHEKSPFWRCMINGKLLKIGQMDLAYVQFIKRWVSGGLDQAPLDIIEMHAKVERMIKENHGNQIHYRDTSPVELN